MSGNSHLRVVLATPSFALGAGLMLLTRKILGDKGAEIVGWDDRDLSLTQALHDALILAAEERAFALACEERYVKLEQYALGVPCDDGCQCGHNPHLSGVVT
jgi:hypothetical protein